MRGEKGGYAQHATARGHEVVGDETKDDGGADRGMTPTELLLASLGSCKTITVRMYAAKKGWPLEDVVVHLSHDKEEAAKEDGTKEVVHRIRASVRLEGALDADQRARLLDISTRCPIHRMLQGKIEIESRLA